MNQPNQPHCSHAGNSCAWWGEIKPLLRTSRLLRAAAVSAATTTNHVHQEVVHRIRVRTALPGAVCAVCTVAALPGWAC